MCIVSAIGDEWRGRFPERWPNIPVPETGSDTPFTIEPYVTRREFDKLKAELEMLREILVDAIEFDKATGQPDCETDEKVELIRTLAKALGVDMSEVFGSEGES